MNHVWGNNLVFLFTITIESFRTDTSGQTVKKQSDLVVHCSTFHLHHSDTILYIVKTTPPPPPPPHDKINKMACAHSKDADQPGHLPSLIRVFIKKAWILSYPLSAQRRLLIRLGRCPDWSESSLGTQSFCWLCHEVAQLFITIFWGAGEVFRFLQSPVSIIEKSYNKIVVT